MPPAELRFRQIHLDFHTSEAIDGIGAAFDAGEFAATLERAHVDSITCFARGHHGWLYYDSKAFPERVHPHLANRNLLAEQIEACHARNIRAPVYITVQWDNYTAQRHPEWHIVEADGTLSGQPPYEAGFYGNLCVNTPYFDFLKAMTRDLLESVPVDGIFFDIVMARECSCRYCRTGMQQAALNPASQADRMTYALQVNTTFKQDMTVFVRQFNTDCTIFYNAGHIGPGIRDSHDTYTHYELESLPSGGWGYLHFPITMRYARNLGIDCLSHTGKFHTSWGDFHSFKNREALQFECFHMLALNAKCMIGDQLHPNGKIDPYVYDLIGSVYAEVEQKEPWCRGARAVTDVGVLSPEEFSAERIPPAMAGATRMLQEAAHQFDVLDTQSDLSPYRLIILPDRIPVSDAFAEKLQRYLADGGTVIASFESGLNTDQTAFATEAFGVTLALDPTRTADGQLARGQILGRGDYAEYLRPEGDLAHGLYPTEYVMYLKGTEVTAAADSEVLAHIVASYFDRTWEHYCSHAQTPSSGQICGPGIARTGQVIYFSHPVFTQYHNNAPRWCKTLVLNAIDILMGEPLFRHSGPSSMLAALNEQTHERRWVVHLLHYIPERRSQDIDVIEDVIPVYDIPMSVRIPHDIRTVRCVPQQEDLEWTLCDGRIEWIVPKLDGHQMIELAW